jgi:hypothetical protein
MVITGCYFYKNGTIRISGWSADGVHANLGDRGVVRKFSNKSRQRLALFVSETTVRFQSMLTLTYPLKYTPSGPEVKKNLQVMLRGLESKFPMLGYLWFLEFTKKGQAHFHILLDVYPSLLERHQVALKWAYLIAKTQDDAEEIYYVHSREDAFSKIRKPDGAIRYALKYSLKTDCKKVPERFFGIGRFWGFNKKVRDYIPKADFVAISEHDLREVLMANGNPVANFDYLPQIIFNRTNVSRETIGQSADKNLTT